MGQASLNYTGEVTNAGHSPRAATSPPRAARTARSKGPPSSSRPAGGSATSFAAFSRLPISSTNRAAENSRSLRSISTPSMSHPVSATSSTRICSSKAPIPIREYEDRAGEHTAEQKPLSRAFLRAARGDGIAGGSWHQILRKKSKNDVSKKHSDGVGSLCAIERS